jgi:hypothetical protein
MAILLPFLFSLDSIFASFVLGGSRIIERSRQMKLALAFGVCDGVASLVRGALGPRTGVVSWLASRPFHIAFVTYLIVVFLVWVLETAGPLRSPLLWTVPAVLALDNLAGPGLPFSMGSAGLVVLASSSMSLVGFRLGSVLAGFARNMGIQRTGFGRVAP